MAPSNSFQRNPSLLEAEMDDELIMLDIEANSYVSLNQVGAHIWQELGEPKTQDELVASVQRAFDTPAEAPVESDVAAFVAHLLDKGMVHVVE